METMALRGVTSIDFWARELRLPLFWFTDPEHAVAREDILIVSTRAVFHMYALNGKGRRGAAEAVPKGAVCGASGRDAHRGLRDRPVAGRDPAQSCSKAHPPALPASSPAMTAGS